MLFKKKRASGVDRDDIVDSCSTKSTKTRERETRGSTQEEREEEVNTHFDSSVTIDDTFPDSKEVT